nr:phosphoribosyltransferase family protein [Leifsonia psychrotolerans]
MIRDQVGLGREARSRNKRGTLHAPRSLAGRRFVIIDDILTTGATVREARRAVIEAGGEVVGIATLAQTQRLYPDHRHSQQTDQQML